VSNKQMPIKSFADLRMASVPHGGMVNPKKHPASEHLLGSQLQDPHNPTHMQDEGDTKFSARGPKHADKGSHKARRPTGPEHMPKKAKGRFDG
jgi:hypothetical protein